MYLLPTRLAWAPVLVTLQVPTPCHFEPNNGDFTLSTQLIANGADGGNHTADTVGKIGGYNGVVKIVTDMALAR